MWLVTGVNEVDPEKPGTIYNSLLYHAPDGTLAEHHRKLVPTNHERLVWGQGDGRGLRAFETPLGRIGGLICWENYMPLARFSLYESGVEIYIAWTPPTTATPGRRRSCTSRASRARSSSRRRTSSVPSPTRTTSPLRDLLDGDDLLGRGGSAILGPDGGYLAGPLYGEEGVLYADLEADRLYEERQRFDPPATTTGPSSSTSSYEPEPEQSAEPPGHAGRRDATSSVAPVSVGYQRSLRPCLAPPSAPRRRGFAQAPVHGLARRRRTRASPTRRVSPSASKRSSRSCTDGASCRVGRGTVRA